MPPTVTVVPAICPTVQVNFQLTHGSVKVTLYGKVSICFLLFRQYFSNDVMGATKTATFFFKPSFFFHNCIFY